MYYLVPAGIRLFSNIQEEYKVLLDLHHICKRPPSLNKTHEHVVLGKGCKHSAVFSNKPRYI